MDGLLKTRKYDEKQNNEKITDKSNRQNYNKNSAQLCVAISWGE